MTPELDTITDPEVISLLKRIDSDLRSLRSQIEKM